jgi:hypothetical protein
MWSARSESIPSNTMFGLRRRGTATSFQYWVKDSTQPYFTHDQMKKW